MVFFNLNHKLMSNGITPETYIADEEYNQYIEFNVSGLDLVSSLQVATIKLSTNPLGATDVLAEFNPNGNIFSNYFGIVQSKDLKGVSKVYAHAYDANGQHIGYAESDEFPVLLWIYAVILLQLTSLQNSHSGKLPNISINASSTELCFVW